MKLTTFAEPHLLELMRWFPDHRSCTIWSGPEFRFPFTAATFREDIRLQLPSYSLVSNESELLGFGQYYLRAERCHLARLVVAPRHRGRAAGAFLICELARRGCSELKVSDCSLFVLESNTPAVRLYTRLGFRTTPYPGEAPPIEGCIYMVATAERIHTEIREETPADVEAIESVTAAAFNSAPHTSHTEQFIVNALREAGALVVSLVAEIDGEVAGHIAVSPVSISDGAPGWFGLGPLSVLPQRQGRGIGSLLVHEALRRLRESGAAGCVLLGDPAYYKRFGFAPEPSLVLPGVPPDYFLAISFRSTLPCGIVSYHEAFNAQS